MGNDFSNLFEKWLNENPVEDKDNNSGLTQSQQYLRLSRKRLKEMPSQAALDLHGMTSEEAKIELRGFLKESLHKGYRKVLIIHGKGYHSDTKSVLRKVVYSELDSSAYAGERGIPPKREGGAGAVWVLLRQKYSP